MMNYGDMSLEYISTANNLRPSFFLNMVIFYKKECSNYCNWLKGAQESWYSQ